MKSRSRRKATGDRKKSQAPVIRRRVNVRLLVVTFSLLLLLVPGVYLLHRYQVGRSAMSLVEEADRLEAEQQWGKAAEYVDRYLRLRPDDTQQRVRLAATYAEFSRENGSRVRAIELYYTALASIDGDAEIGVREKLAELLIEEERWDDAMEVVAPLPETSFARIRVRAIAGYEQYVRTKDVPGVDQFALIGEGLEAAQAAQPEDEGVARRLAELYLKYPELLSTEHNGWSQAERESGADRVMEQLAVAAPDDPDALLTRFRFARDHQGSDGFTVIDHAINQVPEDVRVLMAWCISARERADGLKDENEAKSLLETAKKRYSRVEELRPDLLQCYLGLGETHLALDEVDEAIAAWGRGLDQPEVSGFALAYRSAEVELRREPFNKDSKDRVAQAIERVKREFVTLRPRLTPSGVDDVSRAVSLLEANLAWVSKDLPGALVALRSVTSGTRGQLDETGVVFQGWMLTGEVYSKLEQPERAAEAFSRASILRPQQALPVIAEGTAWAAAGRTTLAVRQLKNAVKLEEFATLPPPKQAETWFQLVKQQFAEITENPESGAAWKSLEGFRENLEPFLADGVLERPWRVTALDLGVRSVRDPEFDRQKAAEWLQGMESHDDPEFLRWLALTYEALGQTAATDRIIESLQEDDEIPTPETLALEVQMNLQREPDTSVDISAAPLLEAIRSATGERKRDLQRELVDVLETEGRYKEALAQMESSIGIALPSTAELEQLARLALAAGQFETLARYQDQMPKHEDGLGDWTEFEVERLLALAETTANGNSQEDLAAVTSLIEKMRVSRPEWPRALVWEARLHAIQGNNDDAIESYLNAIKLGERRISVFEQTATLLAKQRRYSEVPPLLNRLKFRPTVRLEAIGLAVATKMGRLDQAEKLAEAAVARRPDDPEARVWLSQVQELRGNLAAAEETLNKAISIAPADATARYALFAFLRRKGDDTEARNVLEQLGEKADLSDVGRALTLAQGYLALGDIPRAGLLYTEAAKLRPDDAQIQLRLASYYLPINAESAEKALRRAIELDPENQQAPRLLAMLLSNQGPERWDEAISLLATGQGNATADAGNVRIQAMILLRRGRDEDLEEARALIEREDGQYSIGERWLLARILLQESAFELSKQKREQLLAEAEEHLSHLSEGRDAAYEHLAAYIVFLLDDGRSEDCEVWLERYRRRLVADENEGYAARVLARYVELQMRCDEAKGGELKDPEQWIARLERRQDGELLGLKLRLRWLQLKEDVSGAPALIEEYSKRALKSATGPEKVELYRTLGDICMAVNLSERAEQWYRKAVDVDPRQLPKLAMALDQQGRKQEAIALCLKMPTDEGITGQDPAVIAARLLLSGQGEGEAGDLQSAARVLEEANARRQDNVELLTAWAGTCVLQGDDEKAIRLLRRARQLDPNDINVLSNLSVLLSANDDPEEALEIAEKTLEVHGNRDSLFVAKAAAFLVMGRDAEAVALFDRAVQASKGNPVFRLYLAAAHLKVGDLKATREAMPGEVADRLEKGPLSPRDHELLKQVRTAIR